ncbi:hypothetical protein DFQ30_003622 [Apophysomyces sp. BC1015]|nr:hypothetical protein DFQ30_003622 [Apophysomyces sp. BC1015]
MQRKSLWGSYKSLAPRTRMYLGLGGMVFATVGLFISDSVEQIRPASEPEKQALGKLSPVVVVERNQK